MEKKEKKKVTVFLTEREVEMLKDLMNIDGYTRLPEAIHASIRAWHGKRFTASAVKIRKKLVKEEKTDEGYCVEVLGGEVDEVEGLCVIKQGGLTRTIPLGLVKKF